VIIVSQDIEGVRMAALELLEGSIEREKNDKRLDAVNPDDFDQLRKLAPKSKLSPGYQDWALYLFWIERHIGSGISFADLRADEADGLGALQRARQQFEHEHPPCPACGTRLGNRMLRRCFACGKELR
jgi:hypothetical protein